MFEGIGLTTQDTEGLMVKDPFAGQEDSILLILSKLRSPGSGRFIDGIYRIDWIRSS